MVGLEDLTCPNCGGNLKYYDNVHRVIRTKRRVCRSIRIRRFKCSKCKRIHREIPDEVHPYKQYETEIIRGVLEGLITSDTYGFEDYPSEMTMKRWKSQKKQISEFGQSPLNFDEEMASEFI